MRAFITGVTGFVGSWLAKRLLEEGWEVYGLIRGRSDGSKLTRLKILGIDDKVRLVYGDMTDSVSLQRAVSRVEPEIVFHLAAQSFVGRSFEAPLESFNINATGTVRLLEAVRHFAPEAKVIVAGSSEEYGKQFLTREQWEASGRPYPEPARYPELPIREENPLRPVSPYALSKVAEDYACRSYAMMYGLRCIPLRPFNTEGPLRGEHFVTANIVKQLMAVKRGEKGHVELGNVAAMRDWSHIDDIVEAYLLAATRLERYGEPYNVGSGRMYSVLSFLLRAYAVIFGEEAESVAIGGRELDARSVDDYILEHWRRGEEPFRPNMTIIVKGRTRSLPVELRPERLRPADVPHLQADSTKFRSATGWRPRKTLDDIIVDLARYYSGEVDPASG